MKKNGTELMNLSQESIRGKIYSLRGLQVMLDKDLAELYGVGTKRLNERVKRNIERFPKEFMFKATSAEYEDLRSQNATLEDVVLRSQIVTLKNATLRSQNATSKHERGGRRYLPYVFTEQGVSMLASVLKSKTAIKVSIQIILISIILELL